MKHNGFISCVKTVVGVVVAVCLSVLFIAPVGCDRSIPVSDDKSISGYQIRGRVTDQLGNPIPYIEIRLFYNYDFVDSGPPLPRDYNVTDSTQLVTVSVYDRNNQRVKILFQATRPKGLFKVEWDSTDAGGVLVSPGIYWVKYFLGDQEKQSYAVAVDGSKAAATDANGQYKINDLQLPILFYPVSVYYNSSYLGNFSIDTYVGLLFVTPQRTLRRNLPVKKDLITQADVTIQ